jgi:hypothetical protein
LDCKTRFPHTSSADNYKLVLSKELVGLASGEFSVLKIVSFTFVAIVETLRGEFQW